MVQTLLNPQQRAFHPRGAARKLWTCRDEEILIEGPAGTGKTRAICEKMHFCAMKYPGFRGLMVRKTRESLTDTVLVTFEEKVVAAGDPLLEGPKRNLRQVYRYPNGSEIVVGGLDKTMKIMSSEYDMIATFESTELIEDDFENLTTRLRNWVMPYQQIVADCNPGSPNHWLNKRPIKKGMTRLLSRHYDNPVYFALKQSVYDGKWYYRPTEQGSKYLAKLERLSGVRRLRLFLGLWAAAEGMVYEAWDSDVHILKKRINIPSDWRRIRVVDFGFKNPFVCQWWAMDPVYNRMYMYREIYYSERLVSDHAKDILRLSEGERIEATVCDHDLEDRNTLHEAGIFTIPAYKDIVTGIQAVQLRLRHEGDETPQILFLPDSLVERDDKLDENAKPMATVQEIEGYVYKKNEEGKPIKEEPIKVDDHGCDTMRYAVAYVDNINGMTLQAIGAEASVVN
jgi:PBSX family phage terminase large subunit